MIKTSHRLSFFIGVGVLAMIGFAAFVQQYVFKSQAAQSTLTVQFSPQSGGALSDGNFNIVLKPDNTTDKISGADVVLNVQNGTITSWQQCKPLAEGSTAQLQTLVERTGASARYGCVILDKDENLVNGIVLSGALQCTGTSPITVRVDTLKSQVTGPVEGAEFTINTTQTVTYNCAAGDGPTPTPNADIQAEFEPTTCRGGKGSACNYTLTLKSDGTKKISAFYVKLTFDKLMLKAKSVAGPASVKGLLAQSVTAPTPTPGTNVGPAPTIPAGGATPTPNPGGTAPTPPAAIAPITGAPTGVVPTGQNGAPTPPTPPATTGAPVPPGPLPVPQPPVESTCSIVKTDVNNEIGTAEILYVCDHASAGLKSSLSSIFSFDSIAEGEGTLDIAEIQVVGPQATGGLYSVNRTAAKYIIGKSGNVDVKLKLRLQGIVKKPAKRDTMKVKVGVGDGALEETSYKTVDFKSDDNGHFVGTANFELPTRKDYKLLIKCEHCMQRKVCVKDAKESEAGAYACDKGKIELKNGENVFDLTGIVQLACDIPAGEQDGVCNSKDFVTVRGLLGKSEDDAVRKADLNFDGIVNAVDFSLMTAAYLVHTDQQ